MMLSTIKSWFTSKDELEQIALFQLEGLIGNQIPFLLLDLRRKKTIATASKKLENLLVGGTKTNIEGVEDFLTENSIAQDYPVVLVCDDGKGSRKMARSLMKKGRVNIYFVSGGVKALEQELN